VTVACAKKLVATGKIPKDEEVVLCITGHGLKTVEALTEGGLQVRQVEQDLWLFDAYEAALLVESGAWHQLPSGFCIRHSSGANILFQITHDLPPWWKRAAP
jgi:hypothetical protein